MNIGGPVAYDLGMNNGDDSHYYLSKGYTVIGIDANPDMCELCRSRFSAQIATGQMTILNVGVSNERALLTFSINVEMPAISTFEPERFNGEEWVPPEWKAITVEVWPLSDIIAQYGKPDFVKIDVEFYDHLVLSDLLKSGIVPPYMTTEAHQAECFERLVEMGYRRFRLMQGDKVHERFNVASITKLDGEQVAYNFSAESSGPFGNDFPDPWLDVSAAREELAKKGYGWIDIHASR